MPNTPAGHSSLQRKLGLVGGQIIALEPTGGYEWAIWESLDAAGYDVRQVSAAHVRAFSRATGALAKTDPIDARLITDFIASRSNAGRKLPAKKLRHLNVLSTKRRQLVELRKRVKCQIKQHDNDLMVALDAEILELLSRQIKGLENAIQIQIIGILKEQEIGERTADVCRRHGLSQATFCKYKSKYDGLEVSVSDVSLEPTKLAA